MTDPVMINDTAHWQNLRPPLAPNEFEISLYKEHIAGLSNICLLGMTKELVPLCDLAVDLKPLDIGKPTIQCDWNELPDLNYGAIIGDGVLNLTGLEFVDRLLKMTQRVICRVFMKQQIGMKYAASLVFPTEFPKSTSVTMTQENIALVVWHKD
jgi:hypothetical protein